MPATEIISSTGLATEPVEDLKYLAREFVQCAFPYKNPGQVEEWVQDFHGLVLTIRRGRSDFGIPYGVIAKLGTIWLCTEIVEKPHAERYGLGQSLAEIMREVGYNEGARKSSRRKQHMTTLRDLFAANISFTAKDGGRILKADIGYAAELWGHAEIPSQGNLFPSWVQPTAEFKQHVLKSFVPVPLWALRNHLHSPLELDLLFMLSHRVHMINNRQSLGGEFFIPTDALKKQFGHNYDRHRDFRREFARAVANIQTKTWNRDQAGHTKAREGDETGNALQASFTREGLTIYRSAQLVKSRQLDADRTFSNRRKAMKPEKLAKAKAILAAREIDEETRERARMHLRGLSLERTEAAFWAWVEANGISVHDPRALFIDFCVTHRSKNR